jgi:hypothetical protein
MEATAEIGADLLRSNDIDQALWLIANRARELTGSHTAVIFLPADPDAALSEVTELRVAVGVGRCVHRPAAPQRPPGWCLIRAAGLTVGSRAGGAADVRPVAVRVEPGHEQLSSVPRGRCASDDGYAVAGTAGRWSIAAAGPVITRRSQLRRW